jgi:hypothetical protein
MVAKDHAELIELFAILSKLPSLGIIEINMLLLSIVKVAIPHLASYADVVQTAFGMISQTMFSLYPELYSEVQTKPSSLDSTQMSQVLRLLCETILLFLIHLAKTPTLLMTPLTSLINPIARNIDKV